MQAGGGRHNWILLGTRQQQTKTVLLLAHGRKHGENVYSSMEYRYIWKVFFVELHPPIGICVFLLGPERPLDTASDKQKVHCVAWRACEGHHCPFLLFLLLFHYLCFSVSFCFLLSRPFLFLIFFFVVRCAVLHPSLMYKPCVGCVVGRLP